MIGFGCHAAARAVGMARRPCCCWGCWRCWFWCCGGGRRCAPCTAPRPAPCQVRCWSLAATASHPLLQLFCQNGNIRLSLGCGRLAAAYCCVTALHYNSTPSHRAAVPDPATAPMRRRSSSAGAAGMAAPVAATPRQTEQPAGALAPSSASAGGRPAAAPQAHGSTQAAGEQGRDERPAPPPRGSLAELRQAPGPERARAQQEATDDEAGPSGQ